ncbi:unnamed protein product [Agarophyton chilense]
MTSHPAFASNIAIRAVTPRSSAAGRRRCASRTTMELEVGQKVRVAKSVIMYHYPGKRNQPVDTEGFEGVVSKNVSHYEDVPMSATAPFIVEFSEPHSKFKAHFQEDELEVL